MKEYKVELVKYDTLKTSKRKRSNLFVSAKTRDAVIDKLEQIHKGDEVTTITELVWGEAIDKKRKVVAGKVLTGVVKFYEDEKGFGFIEPDGDDEDLFFHSTALGGVRLYEHDIVEYEMSQGPKGPIAIHIKLIKNSDD
ncbi:cold shock domain-containing protein [Halobacteriovorax sp. JY17]|uniref:cold-shock protein n=1 Tax=Halobacteriovorax sp. JY17 TaxID=2014617 RepID=UPI000C474B87|nr:cold shock domain-containing protein [Halobacteriovorax sp. JY17]PIK13564.1 MAG: hypothetical protein CES88_15350 [Halobacteriovorax sp. JY17]